MGQLINILQGKKTFFILEPLITLFIYIQFKTVNEILNKTKQTNTLQIKRCLPIIDKTEINLILFKTKTT